VLEAKVGGEQWQREAEYEKLRGYLRQFHYQHAVYLEFPRKARKPRWCWIADPDVHPGQHPQEFF